MASALRIVALGDSTTAGTPGFNSPLESSPDGSGDVRSQFGYWLGQARPGWQVLNRGVNGERSDQIALRLARDVLMERPAAVILIAGVNDVYQGHPVEAITSRLEEMYQRVLAANICLIVGTILPYNTATALQNDAMRAVNDWIAERATAKHGIWYCDTRAAVALPGAPDLLEFSPDALHPSVEGYRAMATALEPVIAEALAKDAAERRTLRPW